MRMDICNLDKFIKVNNLQEVTNPVTLDNGTYPTEDGLLSYSIFGLAGSYDRKTIFAYIDLKKRFLHPLMYIMLRQMDHKISKVVNGTGYFTIVNGELVEDNEKGNTGLSWLYENFDELKFRRSGKSRRDNKVNIVETLDKNEIFVNKWLVIPAFYRDVNLSKKTNGKISLDELNTIYVKLLGLTQSMNNEFDFMGLLTESKIQSLLEEIFEFLTHYVEKKDGLIKSNLLGKTVDYSTRGVISAGRFKTNTASNQLVKFSYTGIPLSHLCNLFYPFFVYQIQKWAEDVFLNVRTLPVIEAKSGKRVECEIVNGMDSFTPDKIKKMLSLYIKSPSNRLDTIKVHVRKDGQIKELPLNLFRDKLRRDFTILDLVFIVAHKVCEDKHVYITRYPVNNFQSIYPSRITIMSTYETQELEIDNKYFENYPVINKSEGLPKADGENINYIDTIIPHNTMLESLGADFDGWV